MRTPFVPTSLAVSDTNNTPLSDSKLLFPHRRLRLVGSKDIFVMIEEVIATGTRCSNVVRPSVGFALRNALRYDIAYNDLDENRTNASWIVEPCQRQELRLPFWKSLESQLKIGLWELTYS